MDMSKLPKLSQSPAPPPIAIPAPDSELPASTPQRASQPSAQAPPPVSVGAEAWISIVIGLILLFYFDRILKYLLLRNKPAEFEKLWTFSDKNGQPLAYTATAFFLCDLALALFAVVLVFDGLTLAFARKAPFVTFTLLLTIGTVLFNLFVLAKVQSEIGFQIWPALSIALGGYMAFQQWALLQAMKRA